MLSGRRGNFMIGYLHKSSIWEREPVRLKLCVVGKEAAATRMEGSSVIFMVWTVLMLLSVSRHDHRVVLCLF